MVHQAVDSFSPAELSDTLLLLFIMDEMFDFIILQSEYSLLRSSRMMHASMIDNKLHANVPKATELGASALNPTNSAPILSAAENSRQFNSPG